VARNRWAYASVFAAGVLLVGVLLAIMDEDPKRRLAAGVAFVALLLYTVY